MINFVQMFFVKSMIQREIVSTWSSNILDRFFQSRVGIFLLVGLQLMWIMGIALTRATTNVNKLVILTLFTILTGAIVYLLPGKFISNVRYLKKWLLDDEKRLFIIFFLVGMIVGSLYAYSQRVWVDEENSILAAKMIANRGMEGIELSYRNVPWLRDQHPPLIIIVYGIVLRVFGESLFFARIVSVFFFAGTLVSTYILGRELYNQETGLLSVILFLSFPLVTRLGSAAMMDIQLTFFFSLAIILVLKLRKRPSTWLSLATGLVIGLGLLTKYIMVLIYPVLLIFVLANPSFRKINKYLLGSVLVSVSILSIWFIYAFQIGIFSGQIQRIIDYSRINYLIRDAEPLQNQEQADPPPSANENQSDIVQRRIVQLGFESLVTRIPSSLGIYHILLLIIGGLLVWRNRDRRGLMLFVWIAIVFVILFLTLLDHRYLLMTFPAIAIIIARLFYQYPENSERFIILVLFFYLGSLYLFVDWHREVLLFLPDP